MPAVLQQPDIGRLSEGNLLSAVPVTIISGFLGAGKTTLLNHILSEDHGIRAGVLVNDFGAVNIDAKLVVGVAGDTVDLANGCVCCSIRDDLIAACLRLLQRSEPPDVLIIETSGVSDPAEIVRTFDLPALHSVLKIENLISVVDAERFPGLLENEPAALLCMQVQAADIVVLNKVDLVDGESLEKVKALVREIAPGSRVLETSHGRVPLGFVLGTGVEKTCKQHGTALGQFRESNERHNHDHAHTFSTWCWQSDQPLSLVKLRAVIEALPNTVYRAKGIVYLEELPMYRTIFQMVGKRFNLRDDEAWGSESPRTEIVLIASPGGIDDDALQSAFDECVGTGDESLSPILRLARRLVPGVVASGEAVSTG